MQGCSPEGDVSSFPSNPRHTSFTGDDSASYGGPAAERTVTNGRADFVCLGRSGVAGGRRPGPTRSACGSRTTRSAAPARRWSSASVGSGAGVAAFVGGTGDFAGSDSHCLLPISLGRRLAAVARPCTCRWWWGRSRSPTTSRASIARQFHEISGGDGRRGLDLRERRCLKAPGGIAAKGSNRVVSTSSAPTARSATSRRRTHISATCRRRRWATRRARSHSSPTRRPGG